MHTRFTPVTAAGAPMAVLDKRLNELGYRLLQPPARDYARTALEYRTVTAEIERRCAPAEIAAAACVPDKLPAPRPTRGPPARSNHPDPPAGHSVTAPPTAEGKRVNGT